MALSPADIEKLKAKTQPKEAAARGTQAKPTRVITLESLKPAGVAQDVIDLINSGPPTATGKGGQQLGRGGIDFKVVSELVRCRFSDTEIKQLYRLGKISSDASEWPRGFDADMDRLIERARKLVTDPDLKAMNAEFMAGHVAGKFRVAQIVTHPKYPLQSTHVFYTKGDFINAVVNPKIEVPQYRDGKVVGKKQESRGAWWLGQDQRAEYHDIDFKPGAPAIIELGTRRILNMYSGLACAPDYEDAERKCALYLQHVRDNIAGGDEATYNYILDWQASGVQHPENPGRAALSLRGPQGAGKGMFVQYYGGIFGVHFLHATHKDHVTGKFNSHQALALLIFVDEVLDAHIRRDAQILKTMTSEKTKILERKGIDAVQIDNFARMIFATNEEHPVQIDNDDRRYLANYVQDNLLWRDLKDSARAEAREKYFKALANEMFSGGREALLGLLLQRDISKFSAERIPNTAERKFQKLLSASAGDKVIIAFAEEGFLPGAGSNPRMAPANSVDGRDGIFPAMRDRGGIDLRHVDVTALANIVKRWKFEKHHRQDGNWWMAPPLAELRKAIDGKYPGIDWDGRTEWGAEPEARKAGRDEGIPF